MIGFKRWLTYLRGEYRIRPDKYGHHIPYEQWIEFRVRPVQMQALGKRWRHNSGKTEWLMPVLFIKNIMCEVIAYDHLQEKIEGPHLPTTDCRDGDE